MAGRNKGGRVAGGRGDGSGRGRRGSRNSTRTRTTKTGLTKELDSNIFDLGERSLADLMRTTQIKIAQYIGSLYGGDIMGELDTKTEFITPLPTYPESAEARRPRYEKLKREQQDNELKQLSRKKMRIQGLIDALDPENDTDKINELDEELSTLDNKILQVEYDKETKVKLQLTEEEKGEWRQSQKTYSDRVNKHLLNQQKAYGIIIGQCTQHLQDKLHDNPQWENVNKNRKPLELYMLIKRVVMKQTGDEYPPHNLVENLLAVLTLKQQNNQSNAQWYEKLNTRVDVAESVGVQFSNFTSLWDYCCESRGWGEYETLTYDEQDTIRNDSKERLLAYLLIVNSSNTTTHESVKNNLLESFIAKRDEYPNTRSDAIALLNKYDERKQPPTTASKGTAFTQKGKKKKDDKKKGDTKEDNKTNKEKKNPFEGKECYHCHKMGHSAKRCPNKKKSNSDDNDNSSISSKSSKYEDLKKTMKSVNKQFAQLKVHMESEDDGSGSDDDQSHFQFFSYLLPSHNTLPDKTYNEVSLKQASGKLTDLNLRNVILLDNQSTMSLFCNKALVTNIRKSTSPLTLRSNGGSMKVSRMASIADDKPNVWFSAHAITNILSLKEVIRSYRVTYDSYDRTFIVWREDSGLPNMVFKMHHSGLHFYDPKRDDFSFVVTVADNMKLFSKREVVGAEKARSLEAGLAFPSASDYQWILKSNQVQECPVTPDDAKHATKIWGSNVASLKGKTTRTVPDPVPTDMVAIPAEIRNIHRIVTISIDVFFINKVPFFLTLSRKICFSTVTHLANRKIGTIFTAFK